MLALFLSAVVLGLAFCAPPGTVAAEALRRGLARGFRPAFLVEIGSLFGDTVWAAIALAGAAVLIQNPVSRLALALIGTFYLFRLSYQSFRDAIQATLPKAAPTGVRGDLVTGAVLSLTNPLSIGFWIGAGGGAVVNIVPNPGPREFAIFFAGFLSACVFWCFFYSAVVAFGRRFLTPIFFRAVNSLCGTALAYFGVSLLFRLLEAY
ncbi:MAG TPA: LysE family transporter [Chloroflexota bacterium]|nr:LysE family transporter [Chloroflexota bacterium]